MNDQQPDLPGTQPVNKVRAAAEADWIRRGVRQVTASFPCFACKVMIEWWLTRKRKRVPLNSVNLDPHWLMCRRAFDNKPPTQHTEPLHWRTRY